MSTDRQNNAPVSAEPVGLLLEVRTLGNYGAAYDPPGKHRAYTYDHQPGNIKASRLGNACLQAAAASGGDTIDHGLGLLRELQAQGFGVFDAESSRWHAAPVAAQAQPYSLDQDPAGIRALTADAISGALALGFQGVSPPPNNEHWLAPFWEIGRESAAQAQQPVSGADGLPIERVLIDGTAYELPSAVAAELLRLHLEILGAEQELAALAQQDADKEDAALAEMVHAMFRSGNSVPVTRITIDRKQYDAAIDAARKEQA